jgi:hypothetical protein
MARDSREHRGPSRSPGCAAGAEEGAPHRVPAFSSRSGLGVWGYQRWAQTNAIRIARQWLDADRSTGPRSPSRTRSRPSPTCRLPWRLASELAWRKGNRAASSNTRRRPRSSAATRPTTCSRGPRPRFSSDDAAQAQEAETYLDPETARGSPRALRLAGEIARRGRRFADARDAFQAALQARMRGPAPRPWRSTRFRSGSSASRRARRPTDPGAGAPARQVGLRSRLGIEALRALLADAVAHRDREGMSPVGGEPEGEPTLHLGDIPVCLRRSRTSTPPRYKAMLAPLRTKPPRTQTQEAAQLLGWLTQIGQGDEAVRWGESLDPAVARRPPVAPGIAEALRATPLAELRPGSTRATGAGTSGFLGWAYGMAAARQAGRRAQGGFPSGGACTPTGARARPMRSSRATRCRLGLPQGGGRAPLGRRRPAGPGVPGARHPGPPLPGAARRAGPVPGVQPAERDAPGRPGHREQLCVLRGAHRPGKPDAHRAHRRGQLHPRARQRLSTAPRTRSCSSGRARHPGR